MPPRQYHGFGTFIPIVDAEVSFWVLDGGPFFKAAWLELWHVLTMLFVRFQLVRGSGGTSNAKIWVSFMADSQKRPPSDVPTSEPWPITRQP